MGKARDVLACGGVVERTVDLENGYFINHAIHHAVCEVGRVLNAERIETQALVKPIRCVHRPLGTACEFLTKRVEASVIESAMPGERLCIARQPFTFLYASTFHPKKDYAVQEATTDADCKAARRIP